MSTMMIRGQYARGLPLLGGRIFCSNGMMGGNRGSQIYCFWGSILKAGRCCGMSCGGLLEEWDWAVVGVGVLGELYSNDGDGRGCG